MTKSKKSKRDKVKADTLYLAWHRMNARTRANLNPPPDALRVCDGPDGSFIPEQPLETMNVVVQVTPEVEVTVEDGWLRLWVAGREVRVGPFTGTQLECLADDAPYEPSKVA